MDRDELIQRAVRRGKYSTLFHFLSSQTNNRIEMTFGELERVLGFALPDSARIYRPWWANQAKSGHSQSMAWDAAGWKTTSLDMESGTLVFERYRGPKAHSEGYEGNRTSGRKDEKTEYWVYENWTHKKAIVHNANCSYCNHGNGMHANASDHNGCWHGPFQSQDVAMKRAAATGREEVRECKVCS